jgi:gamma-glutamyltranspeptidase
VEVEPGGYGSAWRAGLEARGHRVEIAKRRWGNMQAVFKSRQSGLAVAASDPRGAEY